MFDPYNLTKNIRLKNRFVMAPMTTFAGNEDLTISDVEYQYYAARAKDVGMVITAETYFQEVAQGFPNQFYSGNDAILPYLKRLATTLQSGGAKAVLQIGHNGRKAMPKKETLVSASAIKGSKSHLDLRYFIKTPRPMTDNEIQEFIEGFYQCTVRAIKSGFDGVEIHGAYSFLLQQFFSGAANHRTDQWGGSLENRARLPLEVVRAVLRAKKDLDVPNFIVGYRFTPEEPEETGITIEQTAYLVDQLCALPLDYLHLAQRNFAATSYRDKTNKRTVAAQLLEVIDGRKTLIGVGEITTLADAKEATEKIGYDLVAIGRALLIDPRFVHKLKTNQSIIRAMDYKNLEKQSIPKKMAMSAGMVPNWIQSKNTPLQTKMMQVLAKALM